jgi:transposase
MTNDLIRLKQWLESFNCKDVAMESTGKYWIPVFNILEDSCNITLANPRFVKNMPGKKTDPNDSRWLGKLHRHGLVPGSFIPPKDIRQLRELTRYRTKLTNMRSSEKNRLQNSLTVCNIMLSNVVSDTFGLSSRKIIEALLNGEDLSPDNLREFVHGKLHKKIPDLQEALNGKLTEHQISKIKVTLEHFFQINECLAEVDLLILEKTKPYQYYISLLETIPGIKQKAAQTILSEIGTDMSVFFSDQHLCSWAGVSPRNNQSAGKKKSTKIGEGDSYLKPILCQCANAAVKSKSSFLCAKYKSVASRRGHKKAIIAVARVMLVAIYHMFKNNEPFKDMGHDNYSKMISDQKQRAMVKELESLGYKVEKVVK